MSTSIWIMFDTFDIVYARFSATKVHGPYASFVATTHVSHRDVTSVISATFPMAFLWVSERVYWSTFP